MTTRTPLLFGFATLVGCAQPLHLQYDHGRAYMQAVSTQADLARPSVAHASYGLSGTEGLALRLRAAESTTDEESGEAEATKMIGVQ